MLAMQVFESRGNLGKRNHEKYDCKLFGQGKPDQTKQGAGELGWSGFRDEVKGQRGMVLLGLRCLLDSKAEMLKRQSVHECRLQERCSGGAYKFRRSCCLDCI